MQTTRRNFIKAGGCLAIGFCFDSRVYESLSPLMQELPSGLRRHPNINAWLEILADGRARVLTGKLELGQGIRTAVAQVAAEELDMQMSQVEVVLADTARTPNEGYTAGSGSIEGSAMSIRYAAAAARQKLLELAAKKLNVPATDLVMANGRISLKDGSRALTFADILDGKQLTDEIRLPLTLKAKDKYRLVGKAIPRDDIGRMVTGEHVYVHDLRFPGMVHARVVRPPAYKAVLQTLDEQIIQQKMPGLLKIIKNGSFLGVIAMDEYQAMRAQQLVREHATWHNMLPIPTTGADQLPGYLATLPVQTQRVREKGDVSLLNAGATIKLRYYKPYVMHGSIGPSCAVALYDKDRLHVWTHCQGVFPLREALAALLHITTDKIHVTGVPGSGCYGHNGADDAAADAALMAMQYPGKHVRLQWSREDEHAWEPYGSAMIMQVEARLDDAGKITHWKYGLWSDTHGTRPGGNADNLLAARFLETYSGRGRAAGFSGGAYRNSEPYYAIPHQQVEAHFFTGPLRVSALRGLGAYANIFAIESCMDELAEKAKKDPYGFRLLHLEDERAKDVVKKLQSITQGQETPNTGMGIAFSRYKNSAAYCAVAARVHVDTKAGTVRVQKMWAVIDAGETINLDGLRNQTEGGMIQSASWTLQEQVQFDKNHITSRDWNSYPIFRFEQVPEVEVVVIDRPSEEPLGAGEAAQGPAAAAIANAVYKACGKRVRNLPIALSFRR
jgi:nicotinate dehydrogenase subunit B